LLWKSFAVNTDKKKRRAFYRNSHREFNKTQIKRFRHSVKLCFSVLFFVDELGYL